ncbi:MAG: hypothetical protein ABI888_05595 [Chloroflexota bacterium]
MGLFSATPLALADRLPVDAALDEAFAPLRARTANISPARVRAAVRWSGPESARMGRPALFARISEISMAAVISALVFSSSLASLSAAPDLPDVSRDPAVTGTWVPNGRNAFQRPMDTRATDYRTTAGDLAANAVTVRRASGQTGVDQEQTSSNR